MGHPNEGDGRGPGDDALYEQTTEAFRQVMMRKLHKHAHKGPWRTMSVSYLLGRAREEMVELSDALRDGATREAVAEECADVANLLMMLADNYIGNPHGCLEILAAMESKEAASWE